MAVSAGVLALASLGDLLLYVVLPVSAAAFGVSLAWVGILLAANRVTRMVLYGGIASFAEAVGPRNLANACAAAAAISTLMYWLVAGGPMLLVARVLWGLAFAGLSLAALAYAVADRDRAGSRAGVSRAIYQPGPALSLSVGAWLAGVAGPREVFLILGLVSLLAIPLAFKLPKEGRSRRREKTQWLPKPRRIDLFFFVVGLAVDGVFAMTIVLMLAETATAEAAMLGAGLMLALRRFGEVLLAPIGGYLGDRLGVARVLFAAALFLVAGFAILASGWAYAGSLVVIAARAVIAALGPALVALRAGHRETLYRLAVMQTWRDFGAAVGPLVTGLLLDLTSLDSINVALVILVLASLATHADGRSGRGRGQ
jgi:DHA1 family inner membrane transport protein